MKTTPVAKIALLALLVFGLTASLGCESLTGAEVYLEGVTMSMDGRTISGLPSQKADVALKVSVKKVSISRIGEDTVIKLSPSGATIVTGPDGISISGLEPEQIEMQWQDTE